MLIVAIHHGVLGDGYTKTAHASVCDVDPDNEQSIREYVCEFHDMCDEELDEILVISNGHVTPYVIHHFDFANSA